MATTAMFVEILIIGLQSLTWIVLLVASIFEIDNISIQDVAGWQNLIIVFVLVNFKEFISRKSIKEAIKYKSLPSFAEMRLRILMQNDALGKFMDYQRSRLRIARATVFNLPLITI